MLTFDFHTIVNKLLQIRKSKGMTQSEVAEASGLSDRTYADIERGSVNMRIETVLKICKALNITLDEILTEENMLSDLEMSELIDKLNNCKPKEKETALSLLSIYLNSL